MGKIFCSKCGNENSGDAVFCSSCGSNLGIAKQTGTTAAQPIYNQSAVLQSTSNQNPAQPQFTSVMQMNYPKASLGSRFLASLVDSLCASIPFLPGYIFVNIRSTQEIGGVLIIIALCWAIYYSFCKDGMPCGQSYGKKMNGLMVVNLTTNKPCTKGGSALRALGLSIPYVGGIIESILVLASGKGRRLGDIFAGTQVIELSEYKR